MKKDYYYETEKNIIFGTEIDDKIYFNAFNLTCKLRITKELKTKYGFDVLVKKGASNSYHKYVDTNFMYAVRDNEELQNLILSKHSFLTKEKLFDTVNISIYSIEHPEVRQYL